jgi:cell division initiation protein
LAENLKGLIKSYEGLVEQREALVKSLRRLSQDALNQIDLSETHFSRIDAKAFQFKAEELSRSNYFSAANAAALAPSASPNVVQREEVSTPPHQEDPQPEMNEDQEAPIDSEEFIETEVESAAERVTFAEDELDSAIFDDQEDELEESSVEAVQKEFLEEEAIVEEQLEDNAEFHTEEEVEESEEPASDTAEQKKEEDKPSSGSFFDQFD